MAEGDGGSSGGGPSAAQGIYTRPLVGSARTTCWGEASSGSSHSTICCLRHRHFGSRRLSVGGLWVARSCAARFSRVGLSAPAALLLTPPEPHQPPSRWRLPWGTWLTAQVPWLATPGRARWGPAAPQPQPCGGWALPSPGPRTVACTPRGGAWLAPSAALPASRARYRRNFPEAAAWTRRWLPARPPPPLCLSPLVLGRRRAVSGCRLAGACPSAGSCRRCPAAVCKALLEDHGAISSWCGALSLLYLSNCQVTAFL